MIDRKHIEQFLKLNGLSAEADDDEIKSLLISARWHEDDVETALVVLRENPDNHKKHLNSIHTVTNTNDRLAPESIKALLGVDIEIDHTIDKLHATQRHVYQAQMVSLVLVSLMIGAIFLFAAMWYLDMGVFYALT